MRSASILTAGFAAVAQAAVSVSGTAEGFASSVTGGGDAEAVYPTSTDELYVFPSQPWSLALFHVSLREN
jgi:pectin lyase